MVKTVISGFDSAWTDNTHQPGALSHIVMEAEDRRFIDPLLATFHETLESLKSITDDKETHLVALDQPTIVHNMTGARPVDRVAGSLLSSVKSGAPPASRSRIGMFDDSAPIWGFLDQLGYPQLPWTVLEPKGVAGSKTLIEVFPALSLLGLVPALFDRGVAARYNPSNRKTFDLGDWMSVCRFVEDYAITHRIGEMKSWARKAASNAAPIKADQDRLDSVICAICGFHWLTYGVERNTVIGDTSSGYMVIATTADTHGILSRKARRLPLSINVPWGSVERPPPRRSSVEPSGHHRPPMSPRPKIPPQTNESPLPTQQSGADIDQDRVENVLLDLGAAGKTITYGELARKFDLAWSARVRSSLLRTLTDLSEQYQTAGAPPISVLVVNRKEGLPGKGFNRFLGLPADATIAQRREAYDKVLEATFKYCAKR